MQINKVTAIFDDFRLKDVEETLIRHGVKGFTLHPVRGRWRYFDSFNDNQFGQAYSNGSVFQGRSGERYCSVNYRCGTR